MATTKNKKTHYATTRPRLRKAKAAVKICCLCLRGGKGSQPHPINARGDWSNLGYMGTKSISNFIKSKHFTKGALIRYEQ